MACKFTFKNQNGETVTLDEAGFKAWLAEGGAQFVASRHGVDVLAKSDAGSDEQQPAKRFEIGATLTKEQRKAVLASLVDVYKQKGAEKETRINSRGDEYTAYPHQPELFEKSDITGAMVRYYVTLPDGRIAHPTELFPDYTQSDIDAALQKQRNDEERDKQIAVEIERNAKKAEFTTPEADSAYWQKLSDDSKKQTAHGGWSIAPPSERVMLTKDGLFYSLYKDSTDINALKSRGWKLADKAAQDNATADQIRAIMHLDVGRIAAYDPAASIVKTGRQWSYMTYEGNQHPGRYDTRKDALAAAERHKELKQDQHTKPEGYWDVTSLIAQERGDRITRYMRDGMSEMEAGKRAKDEVPDTWRPDAQPATEAAKPDTVPLSSVIESANKKHGADLDYADRIHTPTVHTELFSRILDGEVSADEFKASFDALLKNKEAIVAELSGMTKDALFKRFPGLVYRYKNEKKADVVNAAFRDMMDDFTLGEGYSYGMSSGSRDNAIRTIVERTTDQTLADHAKAVQDARAERAATRSKAEAGMQDPQTLDDFQRLIQARAQEIGGAVTFQQARMTLTPEQRERFDTLAAEKSRDERRARADQQKTEVRVAAQTTEGQVIETKHTKTGEPLFVVKAAERVERETYNQWNATAKRMGGWYSSFRGNGAVPGFQFKTRENADAFLQYLGGNTEQAKEVVQERRDAYADDRSQSATERLNEMAAALEDKADASLSVERKANTDRRARQAASAEAAANSDKAMAQTMRNIAAAIESGKAKFLDRIRQKVQVETLQGFVNTAQSDKLRALYPSYAEQQRHEGEKPNAETADYVVFPTYTAFRSDLASLGRALLETDGTKKLGQQIMKVADDVSDAYLKFAKENLHKVSTFTTKDGKGAKFPSKAMAEASILRSGYKGAAIVLPVKRNENLIILSPSEAIKRGVWTGDNDKRITLNAEIGAEIVEKLGKINRRNLNSITAPWQFDSAYDKRKRLSGMGIETPAELRAAVREFIALREAPKEADKIKEMERAMIGRRNDGLDFFPTPASIADEMVETAGIEPGMSVLEPSAGMGHIAERIRAAGVDPDVVELANERKELLEAKGFRVIGRDFMDIKPREFFTFGDTFRDQDGTEGVMRGLGGMGSNRVRLVVDGDERTARYVDRDSLTPVSKNGADSGYDRILMNPPFGDRRDAAHVQHAYELLKPGGRLVSIMGEGVFFGSDKKAQAFREWLEQVGATDEKLDEGTFMDPSLPVNTATNARMVVIDKPGTAPAPVAEPAADSQTEDAAFQRQASDGLTDRQSVQRMVRVQRVVDGIKSKWKNAPQMVVVADMQDPRVPQHVRDLDAEMKSNGATGEPRGFISAGKVYIVAGQHKSVEDVMTTVAHETLGHAGLRGLYGDALKPILRQIVAMRRADVDAKVEEYGFDPKSERDLLSAAEEVLANFAQTQPEMGFVKRAIAAIRNWLRENGLKLMLTDADIIAKFILPARAYIENGRGPGGGRRETMFSRGSQTDSDAFRKWFGNSKVVDSDGKPLVVYHGTIVRDSNRAPGMGDIKAFDRMFTTQFRQHSIDTVGSWFSTNPGDGGALMYAGGGKAEGGVIYPVYLSIQNPHETTFHLLLRRARLLANGKDDGRMVGEPEVNALRKWLKDMGKDGIKIAHDDYSSNQSSEFKRQDAWIALDPEQIKSATGNRGTFDTANADIMFSRTVEMRAAVDDAMNRLRKTFGKPVAESSSAYAEQNRRIREEHVTALDKGRKWLKRQLTPAGLLPQSVFDTKIDRDANLEAIEFDVAHLVGALERAVKSDYKVSADKLDETTQRLLGEVMAGKIGDVPEATKTALLGMRQYIDKMTVEYLNLLETQRQDLLAAAERSGDNRLIGEAAERAGLIEAITANVGQYVHRSYRAFDDKDWARKVPDNVLDDARAYLMARYAEDGTPNAESRAEVVLNEILKHGTAYESMESFVKESKLGAKDLSVLKKRKQIAPEIRALLGEYTDPRMGFAKSATKMSRLIFNQRFLDRVRELGIGEFLFTDDNKPPEATVKIAGEQSDTYAPLNGMWTTPEVNQAFKDALGKEQMAEWYRTIVKMNGMVKYGKTVLSPTTAARNWMSAFFFTVANGHFDMSHMAKSVSMLKEYFGHRSDADKLAYLRELKVLGVIYDTPYAGEMMRLLSDSNTESLLNSGKGLPLKRALDYATKFYAYGDDFWKVIGFENEKRMLVDAGYSEADAKKEAAARIRDTYPTYSMVGRGIQSLRRFPLAGSFVSFPAEIIRTSYNMLRYLEKDYKNPATRSRAIKRATGLAIASSFAYALQAVSMAMLGYDDDDEEAVRLMAAPWQKNSNLLFTGRDADGKLRFLDLSFLDPYNYWKRPIVAVTRGQPWREAIKDVAKETLTPFFGTDIAAGAIFDAMANKKDSGGTVYNEHDAIGSQIADIGNHLRKSLQPGLFANMERTYKAINGDVTASGKQYDVGDEAMGWVGFRVATLDPKVALFYRSFDFRDAKQNAEKHMRDALREPGEVSGRELRGAYDMTVRLRNEAYSDMQLLVKAAMESGLSRREIHTALKNSGVSQADIFALMSGRVPAYIMASTSVMNIARKSGDTFGPEASKKVIDRYREVRSYESR